MNYDDQLLADIDHMEARRHYARKQLTDWTHWYHNNDSNIIFLSMMISIRKADEVELERMIAEMETHNSNALMKKLAENVT